MDHDHVPALIALLYIAPLTVLLLALIQGVATRGWAPAVTASRRLESLPVSTSLASLILLLTGTIHISLVPGHLEQPVLAVSFAAAGIASGFLASALLISYRWRAPAALLLLALLAAYGWTRITGFEGIDVLGLVTGAIEVLGLALLAFPIPISRASRLLASWASGEEARSSSPWPGPRRSQAFAEPRLQPAQDLLPTRRSRDRS